jgi:hypothetical protein
MTLAVAFGSAQLKPAGRLLMMMRRSGWRAGGGGDDDDDDGNSQVWHAIGRELPTPQACMCLCVIAFTVRRVRVAGR